MVTRQEFNKYMTAIYGDEDFGDCYKCFLQFIKQQDRHKIKELRDITKYDKRQRLLYRMSLANNGKELTPDQVDHYISTIEYALIHIGEKT